MHAGCCVKLVCPNDDLLSLKERAARRRAGRGGVAASSSSRVDIAPQRPRDPPPMPPSQPETVRRLPTAAVDADRYRLVGHYGRRPAQPSRRPRHGPGGRTDTATAGQDAAERQKVIKGRVRVMERSSRRLVTSFLLHSVCRRRSHGRTHPTGLRQQRPRHTIPPVYTRPRHKSAQASLSLLYCCFTANTRTICNTWFSQYERWNDTT